MRVIEHRENPFPEDLEGRLNAILNVVNTELKALTLLHLDDTPRSGQEIKARVRETVGKGIYLPRYDAFSDYCHKTLFPIGTVAEKDVIYEDSERIVTGYKLTEAGKKYGMPIVAFTLDYIARNRISMYNILGSTQSYGKSRSPFNRTKILDLLRTGVLREVDLAKMLDLNKIPILQHLKSLKKIGFIQYDSVGELSKGSKGIFIYQWLEGKKVTEVVAVDKKPILTRKVAEKLKELKESDRNQLAGLLEYNRWNVSTILSGLERQGIVKSKKWKGGELLSEASLLDKGKRFVDDHLEKVKDALSEGPALEEMHSLLEQLINDPDKLSEYSRIAIEEYKKVSPAINKKPLEETNEKILDFVRKNPGVRPVEIKTILSLPYHNLSSLVKSGELRKVKEGRVTKYYVNE
ncbi:MAG: hypothetical protein AABW46_04015 [Nanoarchaeota archaeon]